MNYELRFPYEGELIVSDNDNVLKAIELNLEVFESESPSKLEKALALCWLIHLVGDIHQPLHTSILFSEQFPKGDRGGNLFWIKPKGAVKLHSYWDGMMGRSTSIQSVLNEATSINTTHKNNNLTIDMNPVSWSKESFKRAIERVYLTEH